MKRLLAVLLALTMTLTCAPLSALAASDDTLAKRITVEQTTQPDAELVQAIAADPFMQPVQASAPQQEQSASVDTSDISMTATNSFGKLLLDGMNGNEEENGTEFSDDNRVIGIKMNGGTATVEYVAAEAADLVVAVYTDSAAEEMVASGTVSAPATADNTGNSTVQVPVEGSIPEYYTVKAYLLDKAEHAPLSKVFTDTSKTEAIVDIKNAKVGDFDPDRVINLDDDNTTNFAVVAEGVVKVTEGEDDDTEEENSIVRKGQFNIVQSVDDESMVYVVTKPSNRLKYAREGQIVSVEYDGGDLFITRIVRTELNGDTLTIYGDHDFELDDAFEFLKLEEATGNGREYRYVEGSSPEGVTWLGETVPEIEQTNSLDVDGSVTMQQKFKLEKESYKGEVAFGVTANFHFYYSSGTTDISFTTKGLVTGKGTCGGKTEIPISLGKYTLAYKPGISMDVKPQLTFKAEVSVALSVSIEASAGFEWINGAVQTVDENPVAKIEAETEGKVSVDIDLKPEIKVLHGVATVKLGDPVGVTVTFTKTIYSPEDKIDETDWKNSPKQIHACKECFKITSEFGLTLSISVSFLEKDVHSSDIKIPLSVGMSGHWSVDYNDFDMFGGECKHNKYRIVISMDKPDSTGTAIYCSTNNSSFQKLGTLNSKGWLQVYLEPGTYTLSNIPDRNAENRYYCTLPVTDCALNPVLRYATHSGECGAEGDNLTWEISDSGMLSIKGTGKMQDYTEENPAPWPKEEITGVQILKGVTSIGQRAFEGCERMLSANISGTVREIGEYAFSDCIALKLMDISIGTEKIGKYAFNNCANLESVKLPGGLTLWGGTLTRIEEGTFAGCKTLTELTLPDCITEIEKSAFSSCKSLGSMKLPDAVKSIPDEAFSGCSSLKKISFAADVNQIGEKAFYNCVNLQSINLPDGIKTISKQAFFNCQSLTSVSIPDSVTAIEDGAFAGCRKATKIEIPQKLESIGDYAFSDCESLRGERTFTPSGSTEVLIDECMILPETLQAIGDHAFERCSKLDGIVFKDGMVMIGNDVFRDCTSLSAAVLPDSLMYLGQRVFAGCTSLASITIPHDVSQIGIGTFNGCTALKEVTLPGGMETIDDAAFNNCTVLERVNYLGLVADWYTIEIGENNEPIYTAVIHCTDADTMGKKPETDVPTSGTCGDNLTWTLSDDGTLTISGNGPMKDYDSEEHGHRYDRPWEKLCDKIKVVVLENGVTSTGDYAFADCKNLVTISMADTVMSVSFGSFHNCPSLEEVTIPENVTTIGYAAFEGCMNLKKVTIPKTVKAIYTGAFNSRNLKDVYYGGTVEEWKNIKVWEGNDVLNNATIHCTDGNIIGKENLAASGNCGENITWTLDVDGTLTISGTGNMPWQLVYPEWYDYAEDVLAVQIDPRITSIGTYAFFKCKNLESVTIPENVTKIGDSAFSGCEKLENIIIPTKVTEIGLGAFSDCHTFTRISIPDGVTKIWGYTFFKCENLEEVIIPDSVTSIEEEVFYGCENLKKVVIPDGVTAIANGTFQCCSSLEEIVIPDGVTSIGNDAFEECESLKEIIIPDGVTNIGESAFMWCNQATKIVLPAGITEIPKWMLAYDIELLDVTIPENVTSIGKEAFVMCGNLTKIVVPKNVITIGEGAFSWCSGLTEITISNSVQSIEAEAFNKCSRLTDVYYDGTKEQWQAISIDSTENDALLNATIHCTDGDITPETDSTNAISFGTTTQSSETYHALFSGLTAGEDYAVIVSRSAEQPLKAENLAYIIQLPAGADGTLDVKFKAQNAEDLSYVVACRRGEDRHSIEVTHGRSSDAEAVSGKQVTITAEDRGKEGYKFSKWAVLSGDVTLANAEQAETTFVMGCQDVKLEAIYVREGHSIRVIDGTADKNTAYKDEKVTITAKDRSSEGKTFVKWNVLAGGVTLADASSPSTTFVMGTQEVTVQAVYQAANTNPGTSGGSGGGGGGGGAIALIGGAAVVAGVVAMLPAKVSGVVLSADAVLPNAAVQLVQKGAVVAQTVTDANGSFTLKAKRGAYQLNITYQDAAGQPVTQSVAVTAPAENLTLRF